MKQKSDDADSLYVQTALQWSYQNQAWDYPASLTTSVSQEMRLRFIISARWQEPKQSYNSPDDQRNTG